jgi:hypothetical protein
LKKLVSAEAKDAEKGGWDGVEAACQVETQEEVEAAAQAKRPVHRLLHPPALG